MLESNRPGRTACGSGQGVLWVLEALALSAFAASAVEVGGLAIHLDEEPVADGVLRGSVTGDWQERIFRLVWVDGLGRAVSHAEFRPKASQRAVPFSLGGDGALGTQHRLFLVAMPQPRDRKAPQEWQVVAKAGFRTVATGPRPSFPIFNASRELPKELDGLPVGPILQVSELADTPFLPPGSPLLVHTPIPLRSPLQPRNHKEWDQECWRFLADRKPGLRTPDLFDAAAWEKMRAELGAAARQSQPFGPQALMLGTHAALAPPPRLSEYGPDAFTLDLFRAWLRRRYEDLAQLNRQWETSFERWDDVAPLTTDETKARRDPRYAEWLELVRQGDPEKKLARREDRYYWAASLKTLPPPGNENFSSWCDWHAFLDFSFARMVGEVRTAMRQAAPGARVGFRELLRPSPWNGQETYELARVVDWSAAPDDEALALLLQSFRPDAVRYALLGGSGDTRDNLWKNWFDGASGALVASPERNARPDAPLPTDTVRELEWLSAFRQPLAPVTDPVALYYSPRSIAVHWMLDSQLDGSDWPRRVPDGLSDDTPWLAYVAWVALLRDLGVAPVFVAPAQLLSGQVNAKVLILPKVLALSEQEAQAIRDFTLRGGVVIADSQCGTFDGHGRRRPFPEGGGIVGALDAEFGIRRENLWAHELNGAFNGDPVEARVRLVDPCSPAALGPSSGELRVNEPGVRGTAAWRFGGTRNGAAAVLTRNGGTGRYIYLNLALQDYPRLRERDAGDFSFAGLEPKRYAALYGEPTGGEALRVLIGDMLMQSIGERPVAVRDADGRPLRSVQRFRWASGSTVLIGLKAPPKGWVAPVAGEVPHPWLPETPSGAPAAKTSPPHIVKVLFDRPMHWYDLRRRQYLGHGASCAPAVEERQPVLLAGLPCRVDSIKVRTRRLDRAGTFSVELSLQTADDISKAPDRGLNHALAVELLRPDGRSMPGCGGKILLTEGTWKGTVHLGLNQPAGLYRWLVRDPVTGAEGEAHLQKDEVLYADLFPPAEAARKPAQK